MDEDTRVVGKLINKTVKVNSLTHKEKLFGKEYLRMVPSSVNIFAFKPPTFTRTTSLHFHILRGNKYVARVLGYLFLYGNK